MAEIRVMATDLRFPEGPLAMADGSVILGEIAGGTVTRVMPDGTKTVVSAAGGGPNGLALGPDGTLYLCNNGGNEYAEGGFLSTGPVQGLSRRIHPADRSAQRRHAGSLQPLRAAQVVGAKRHRLRSPGRVL